MGDGDYETFDDGAQRGFFGWVLGSHFFLDVLCLFDQFDKNRKINILDLCFLLNL